MTTKLKSSPSNRLAAIQNALLAAHQDAIRFSHSSLHRMPEYFMAMRVADYFAAHFSNFGYRLEAQVKRTFDESDIQESDIRRLLAEPGLRADGRFDLVLRTARKGSTAHIIEFKRGDATRGLIGDIRRLAKVSQLAGRYRLKTNYLVLTRRCPPKTDTTDRMIKRLNTALEQAGLLDIDIDLVSSEPLLPLLNHDHQPLANRAFQIVILEIRG